jgi:hypothetical protein
MQHATPAERQHGTTHHTLQQQQQHSSNASNMHIAPQFLQEARWSVWQYHHHM